MEEIELRELIEILIRGKKIIAITTLIAVLIATVFSFIVLEPTYEVKMVLMTSNLGSNGNNTNLDPSNIEDMLDIMSQFPNLNLETYIEQI